MSKASLTPKQKAFIEHYLSTGQKKKSAEAVGVTQTTVQNWFKKKDFLKELETATNDFILDLRAALLGRAKAKSDTLGIFFLKAHHPEKYDDAIRKMIKERELGGGEDAKPEQVIINIMPKPDR